MEFKQPTDGTNDSPHDDITEGESGNLVSEIASAAAASGSTGRIPLLPNSDNVVVLPAGASLDDLSVQGRDIIVKLPDGRIYVIPDGAVFVPVIAIDGVTVPPLNLAAYLTGDDPQPAAGTPQSSGGNFADAVDPIQPSYGLGDLLPYSELARSVQPDEEVLPGLVDKAPGILFVPRTGDGTEVRESHLPPTTSTRLNEPEGSQFDGNSEVTTGVIQFVAEDGLGSFSIAGVVLVPGSFPQTIVSDQTGTLVVTSLTFDPVTGIGEVSYEFTLNDNTFDPDGTTNTYDLVVTDTDGDSASDILTINIVDDVPTAAADSNSVDEGGSVSGNVLTDNPDKFGADGAVTGTGIGVIGVRPAGDDTTTEVTTGTGTVITGEFGTLTLNADGTYTYESNGDGVTGSAQDVFVYTIEDGDGDRSTTTLIIDLSDVTLVADNDTVTVNEAALDTVQDGDDLAPGTVTGSEPASTAETTGGTLNVPGATSYTLTGSATGAYGTIELNADGSYTYTLTSPVNNLPNANDGTETEAAGDVFSYVATDANGNSVTGSITVNIIDDIPDAQDDSASLTEGGPSSVTFDVDTNDTPGADGTGSRIFDTLNGTYGDLTLNGNGTQTYTLNAAGQTAIDGLAPGATLTDTFNYTLTDGDGDADPAVLTITLNGVNDPVVISGLTPKADGGDVTVDEDDLVPDGSDPTKESTTQAGTFTISAPDGIDDLTVGGQAVITNGVFTATSFTTPLGNTLAITGFNSATGEISYTYTLDDNETHANADGENSLFEDFAVVLTDVDTSSANDILSVNIIDDIPDAQDDSASLTEGGPSSVTFDVDTNDTPGADGTGSRIFDTLNGTYGDLTLNGNGTQTYTLNAAGQTAIDGLAPGATLTDTFNYTLTDGDGDADPAVLTITLNGVNDPVVISGLTPKADGGDVTVDEDDLVPDGSDPTKESTTQAGTFTISAPDGIDDLTVGGQAVITNGVFTATSFTTPLGNTLAITGFNSATGEISYTYTLDDNETHANADGENSLFEDFAVVLTDVDTSSANDILSVNIIDDVPTANPDSNSVTEGGSVGGNVLTDNADIFGADGPATTSPAGGVIGVRAAGGDTTTEVTGGTGALIAGQFGTLTLDANGTYTYNSTADSINADAQDVFVYSIEDGDGDRSTTTLTINLADVSGNVSDNNALVDESGLDAIGSQIVPDGEFFTTGQITVTGTASPLTYTLTSPADGSFGTLSLDSNSGSYSYTLDTPFDGPGLDDGRNTINGAESFNYEVTDQFNNVVGTGSITVNIIDDIPDAQDDSASLTEGGPSSVTFDVDTNDTPGADGTGSRIFDTLNGTYGDLTLNGNGTQTYTLNAAGQTAIDGLAPGATLTDTFNYTLTDGDGDADPAVLTITLNGVNDPVVISGLTPKADGGDVTVDEDDLVPDGSDPTKESTTQAGTFTISAPDGIDDLTVGGQAVITNGVFTATSFTTPLGNTLAITGFNSATGEISYTYTLDDNETHANADGENSLFEDFAVVLTDVDTSSANDILSVNIIDDIPDAQDDSASLTEGGPSSVTFDVDTNDTPGADGTGSRIFDTLNGTYGDLTLNGNGTQTYTLNAAGQTAIDGLAPGATLTDTFNYTLTDGDGDADPAVLTITLNGVNDPVVISGLTPKADGGDVTVDEDDLVPDGSDPTKESTTQAGTFTISAPDGIDDLTVGGQAVITNGVFTATSFTTPLGNTLAITGFNSATGEISYTYTLDDNETHANADGENSLFEDFAVVLTDVDTSSANDILSVNIIDDVPTANPDTDSVTEGAVATGNVLTGAGTTSGATGVDVPGADGFAASPTGAVTGISSVNQTTSDNTADGSGNFFLAGEFGTLTLNRDGSYSYQSNPDSVSSDEQDVFEYTVIDSDGDSATTTLTITVENVGGGVNDNEVLVNEAGLDGIGSDGLSNSEFFTTGQISVTGSTGPFTYTLLDPADGTFGTLTLNTDTGEYSYELDTPFDGPGANDGANTISGAEGFDYQVTDQFNNVIGTGAIRVDIIDDVPSITGSAAGLPTLATDDSDTPNSVAGPETLVANFVSQFGADGTGSLVYGLSITGGNGTDSGLDDTLTGDNILLRLVGSDTIEGYLENAPATVAFTIGLNTGTAGVSLDQDRAVVHDDPNDPIEDLGAAEQLAAGLINLTGTITDSDGDIDSASIDITSMFRFEDDGPDAQDDSASLTEGGPSSVTFDVDTNDTPGADGTGSRIFDTLNGTYGDLTLNGNGTQTYTLNAAGQTAIDGLAPGATLTDTFNYTLTDGDGDADPAVLTITLNGVNDPVVISGLTPKADGGDVTVDEDDLVPDGSDPTKELTTQAGTFTISAPDGIDDLTVGGQAVITNGVFTATSFTTPLGNTLAITGFNSATGEISYTYTLDDNETHANADGENSLFEDFAVVLTDVDTSSANDILSVNIIDDIPDAQDDSASLTEGGPSSVTFDVDTNDTPGADGTGSRIFDTLNGTYGDLTLNGNGTQTYTLNAAGQTAIDGLAPGATLTDTFNYTLTDGDGDADPAVLTITLNGVNDPVVISGLTPKADGGDVTVDEDDLVPDGSDPTKESTTQAGTFTISAPDGIDDLTVGGQAVITNGVFTATSFTTPLGNTLAITGFNSATGEISYTYTLDDNETHANADGENSLFEDFAVVLTDVDTSSANDILSVNIIDDIPDAQDDSASLTEGGPSSVTFDVDTNDTPGADGTGSRIFDTLNGTYGDLTLNGNGTQTYTLNAAGQTAIDGLAPGATLTDTFNYTLTDGDGDADPAVLTITLNGVNDPVVISGLTPKADGGDVTVDEDDLVPDGSDPTKESTTQAGTFTISAPDGIDDLTVGGQAVITNGVFTATSFTTPLGNTLAITGFNSATGEISYTYTLDDNETHANADGENSLFEDFAVVLTDVDTSSANDILSVNIIDDIPDAQDDSASLTEGGPSSVTFDVDTNDTPGADGTGSRIFDTLNGTYGDLTLNGNGTQTYTLNAAGQTAIDGLAPGATLTDTFNYTLTDGDGDADPAVLTITLNGVNDPVVISGLTPKADGGDVTVDEDDLVPDGSDPTKESTTQAGTFTISAPDGIDDLTVGGQAVITNGVFTATSFTTPLGNTLAITGFNSATGEISYTYTLDDNETHANADGENSLFEDFAVVLTDVDTSSANDILSVNIIDDIPDAQDDSASLTEGGPSSVTFDVDTNDTPGADGTGSRIFDTLNGTYGDLTLNGNGTQTYTLNAAGQTAIDGLAPGATLTDTFNYTLTDGDGDADPAVLTITLNGVNDPVVISGLTPKADGGDVTVDEDDLVPDGSDPTKESTTQAGTFTISAPDGIDDLTVGGQAVITNGVFTATSFTTPLGNTLAITGFNSATGEISYTYTLDDNETHANADGENSLFEDFAVVLTDVDTSSANDILSVNIIDDVPTANPDTDSVTEGAVATGNVLTGAGTTSGATGVDVPGADGFAASPTGAVTGISSVNQTTSDNTADGSGNFFLAGEFGTLTLNRDGSYSYQSNPDSVSSDEQDVFEYTVIDSDGDSATTTLTINLTDVTLAPDNQDRTVNEAAMDMVQDGDDIAPSTVTGSNPSSTAETVTGTLTVTGTGVTYTPISTTTANGSFELDANGNYTYTLTAPATHPNPGTDTLNNVETFNYTATDANGNTVGGTVTIDIIDDIPSITNIQDGTANNNPGSAVSTGSLNFIAGADGPDTPIISYTTTNVTSNNFNLIAGTQSGNSLTVYADVDGSGTVNGGDTPAFTLTVNPVTGQYTFDLQAPLDGTIVNTPIGGTTSFGAGPQPFQVVSATNVATDPLAIISGWDTTGAFDAANWFNGTNILPAGLTYQNINGSTSGWGVNNNNFTTGEFIRWDFGQPSDDFDGAGGYTPPSPALPEVSFASFELIGYSGADTIQFVVHHTDGTTSNKQVTGAALANPVTLTAPIGKFIDWIDTYAPNAGSGKIDISSVGVQSATVNVDLGFNVILPDGDGDQVSDSFIINVADGNSPSVAVPIVIDLDGDGAEFLALSAGVAFDYDGDGVANATAWVGADDGLLTVDLNQDGIVNDGSEFVFGGNGLTDLEGLALKYDSNQDGQLDANDTHFALFGVWQDANSNGITDAGEWHSLAEMNITSISLVSDHAGYSAAGGDVKVHGEASYTLANDSTGILADASFAVGAERINARNVEMVTTAIAAGVMASAFLADDAHAVQAAPNESVSLPVADGTSGSGESGTVSVTSSTAPSTELFLSDDSGGADSDYSASPSHDGDAGDQDSALADAPAASDAGGNANADWLAASADSGGDEGGLIVSGGDTDASMEALLALGASGHFDGSSDEAGQAGEAVVEEALAEAAGDSFVDHLLDQLGSSDAGAPVHVSDDDLAALLGVEMGGDALTGHNGLDMIQVLEDATALAGTQG